MNLQNFYLDFGLFARNFMIINFDSIFYFSHNFYFGNRIERRLENGLWQILSCSVSRCLEAESAFSQYLFVTYLPNRITA